MDDRMKEIHDKGFNMIERPMTEYRNVEGLDFSKIKVGVKSLQDAILDLGGTKLQYKYFVNAGHIIWNDVAAMTDVWNWLFDQSLENQ